MGAKIFRGDGIFWAGVSGQLEHGDDVGCAVIVEATLDGRFQQAPDGLVGLAFGQRAVGRHEVINGEGNARMVGGLLHGSLVGRVVII